MTATTTIYALSSGPLPAGVAVVRISGPHVPQIIPVVTGKDELEPRQARLCAILGDAGEVIDHALCIYFPAPRSFTGEDTLEIQLHGSKAVVAAFISRLSKIKGLAPAEPGAFTMRAFLNGRMDLTAAEALSDLIVAETEAQRKLALANADGAQRRLYESWRTQLVGIWARVEADLDFSDQEDVPDAFQDDLALEIDRLIGQIQSHLQGYRAAEIIKDGFHIVIAGAPNSGKSSLINYLTKREAAIVTDIPGTTRDLIEVALDIDGRLVRVTDTAGLRDTTDRVEQIGVERARAVVADADLVLLLDDGFSPIPDIEARDIIRVYTKADVVTHHSDPQISTFSGEGISELLAVVSERVDRATRIYDTIPSHLRQVSELERCLDSLGGAKTAPAPELVAEELRRASDALGRLTGRVDVEELLGDIFSRFCIGK